MVLHTHTHTHTDTHTFGDFVKTGMLTLVGEIPHYINDRYYIYYY